MELLQELASDIVTHKSLYDEGLSIELGESTGLPVFPFSLDLLLMATTTAPLREVFESRIRKFPKWTGKEEEVKSLVDGLFPGGTCVVSGEYWEQVNYYSSSDYMSKAGIPQPPYGLGFLEGVENCYLEEFPDNDDKFPRITPRLS